MTDPARPAVPDQGYWSRSGGSAWADLQTLMDRLYQPIGEAVADRADPPVGARVLDVGCGAGATTLDLARRVGPTGHCTGVDISAPLLEAARRRAVATANVDFIEADAQTHDFGEATFDAVTSRFGVMFFTDPDAAFANLRRATKPGGRLTFACWRAVAENALTQVPLEAATPFLPDLPPPLPVDAPGRFAFADPEKVRGILHRSGWTDIEITPLDTPTPLSLDEMLDLGLKFGVLGTALPQQDETVRAQVRAAVTDRLNVHLRDGIIPMSAACWLVSARR
ncbi:class I SAM-dependent methyltransferase [Brevundimonas sp.]|uniref:class I SAM-dependent methyltransferase n=1 Tax=Brevundimonas sp. TaxID=1871086 RepID=UPI0025B9C436|nr:class I SAM-dependent methyltransferase [Brevundimonas sp.]